MDFNLARIHEAIAASLPERECLVFRERRALENWESGQDHVALYLHNGNECLEGMQRERAEASA